MISGINHTCRSETKKQDVKLEKFILKIMLSQKKIRGLPKTSGKSRFLSEKKAQTKEFCVGA
jgi:hypothetical protein